MKGDDEREVTSIKILRNLWKAAKVEAIKQDKTVSEFVEESIRAALKAR